MSIGFHIMFEWLQNAMKMLNLIILLVKQVLEGIERDEWHEMGWPILGRSL